MAGRPAIGRMVNVRLPEELIATLDEMADEHGITRAEMIRTILLAETEGKPGYSARLVERGSGDA